MILYNNYAGASQVLFIFQLKGSVFPFAFCIALPAAVLSLVLKLSCEDELLDGWACLTLLSSSGGTAAWSGFTFLVGFVIVFRTSQAYSRFWEALADTHSMLAEWFDAISSIVAFTRSSQGADKDLACETFLHTIVRVFSMLSASALQDLSDVGSHQVWGLEVLDPGAIDDMSISTLDGSMCRVELIYSWIQQLVVEKMSEGIVDVPAPLTSRVFAEMASGMAKYQDARKHARVPFPFPYAQTTMTLLLFHWILTPLVMIQWSGWAAGSAIFTFVQVFTLWSMNAMATQFERPFGSDANCIDALEMQELFNKKLVLLMNPRTRRTPSIDPSTFLDVEVLRKRERIHAAALKREGWELKVVGGGKSRAGLDSKAPPWLRAARLSRRIRLRVMGYPDDSQLGKPQVAVSMRYSVKRYGIVDGQRTAVLTIGIFKDELVVALPTIESDKQDLVEVANVDGELCPLTMKRIPIQQRHHLFKAPPPEWDTDYVDFPATFTFRAEALATAFHDLGRKVELVTVLEEGDSLKDDSSSDKSSREGVAERLGEALAVKGKRGSSERLEESHDVRARDASGRIDASRMSEGSDNVASQRGSMASLQTLPGEVQAEDPASPRSPGAASIEACSRQKLPRFLSPVPASDVVTTRSPATSQQVGVSRSVSSQVGPTNSGTPALVSTPSSPAVVAGGEEVPRKHGGWASRAAVLGVALRLGRNLGQQATDTDSGEDTMKEEPTWGSDFVVGQQAPAQSSIAMALPEEGAWSKEMADVHNPEEATSENCSERGVELDEMVTLVMDCAKEGPAEVAALSNVSSQRKGASGIGPRGFSELPT